MINKKFFQVIILLAGIIFFSSFFSAYLSSNAQYFPYSSYGLQTVSKEVCQPSQDFAIQIAPFGCTPAVVRSDLLEENDVPVICQLGATKINPLIEVNAIDSISFSGKYSSQVSGIGFYPAKAALGVENALNSPALNNIGYVVIMLKKQPNASAMPDYVIGNLTAKIKYNVNQAFGIGNALFYLPEFATESDWQARKYQYSFWNGKGYLRAEDVTNDGATISLYTDSGKISSVNLKKGGTSDSIYLPGFECQAGLKLQLTDLSSPDTRAKLRVNSEVVEIAKGEKFLDNKCTLQNLNSNGITKSVTIKCQEDEKTSTFSLTISPNITLSIDGKDKEIGLGDWLYDGTSSYNAAQNGPAYLGYIGTRGNSGDPKDLFAYIVFMPQKKDHSKLTEAELSSINSLVNDLINAKITSPGIISQTSDALKSFSAVVNQISRFAVSGQSIARINFADRDQTLFGKKVIIVSFADVQDREFATDDSRAQYENAKEDYEAITKSFASETLGTGTYGEEALYNEIVLASDANQQKTASDLCKQFIQDYPSSIKNIADYCGYQLSNSQIKGVYVTINKQVKKISFDEIYEPSFDDYGVVVRAETPKGTQNIDLRKNQIQYLGGSGNDYIQLVSAEDGSATVQISLSSLYAVVAQNGATSGTVKLTEDVPNSFANGYTFTLTSVNLKKVAKVSVTSNINNEGTSTNFSFKIGIEQRAISLSPDQIKSTIKQLNKDISTWQNVSDALGNVTQALKTSCIVAGVALVAKNFLLNSGGEGIARQALMRGTNGWYEKCTSMVSAGTYSTQDDCLAKNANKIDSDVKKLGSTIDQQNNEIKQLETSSTTTGMLGDKVVDTKKFMQQYAPEVNTYLNSNLGTSITDPSGKGQPIDKSNILGILTSQGYNDGKYTTDQLKEIELYSKVLNDPSASPELQAVAKSTLYSDLLNVQTNAANYAKLAQVAGSMNNVNPNQIGFIELGKNVVKKDYEGLTLSSIGKSIEGQSGDTPVYVAQASDGNTYLFLLDNSKGISQLPIKNLGKNQLAIYDYNTMNLVENPSNELKNFYFQKYDASAYKNPYKNAKLRYYETEPYKGMPAIVPFDLANGWYAATKQTISSSSTTTAYEANGRVSSFWVCNVGENGMEENIGGDDICEMINTGTGQAYNVFHGLSPSDASDKINKAKDAIEQASKIPESQRTGKVKILGNNIDVGSPAADIPEVKCQDFMSPSDCLLLFNLCDPVICPSSRCNLGGAYPVKDVVQSGIIGSIALCLPNVREGIIMPVCLTGVKAGIDGLLSVQNAYRDCLNESLNTGRMVGICDEIYSLYMCDFLWRQALPFANMIIPKAIETLAGQNVRGGGEYLGISNAWGMAQKSVDYFVNSYGINSKEAFAARTTEGVGEEVCKLYTSSVVPSGADLLNKLTQSDSPPQFTGRFDEMPLSTATVPPTSQYKVYYHIYAGKDSGAYYQVYLKGVPSSSYYQDTSQTVMVASGYAAVGGYATETKDMIATSGYKQLCINVNGQEECGFKTVSTNFAVNYISDEYVSSQANQTDITTESDCVSNSENGIIRICATSNPGTGTDPNAGMANSRWAEVGYCDNKNIKCWIDTQSIQNAIKSTTIENATIGSVSSNYIDILNKQGGYLTADQFSSSIKEINSETDSANKINLINNIIEKVTLSNEKVQLLFLRGNAYVDLFKAALSKLPKPAATATESATGTQTGTETPVDTTNTPQGVSEEQILKLTDARQRVLAEADKLDGTIVPGRNSAISETHANGPWKINENCWTASHYVYESVQVGDSCGYSDKSGAEYSNIQIKDSNNKNTGKTTTIKIGVTKNSGGAVIYQAAGSPSTQCTLNTAGPVTSQDKLDNLKPGDLISYVWSSDFGHNAVFIKWVDKSTYTAELFDWNGPWTNEGDANANEDICTSSNFYKSYNGCKNYRYYTEVLSDTGGHPVWMYWEPYILGQSTASGNNINPATLVTEIITKDGDNTIPFTLQTQTITIGDKIANAAAKLITDSSTEVATKFVSHSLVNAGVSGIEVSGTISSALPSSLDYLTSLISKDSDFSEVDVSNLKLGDIVLIGQGCKTAYSIGIFDYISNGDVYVYTNLGSKAKMEKISSAPSSITTNLLSSVGITSDNYIYRAYRYTEDLSISQKTGIAPSREKWTPNTAITKVSTLKGSYNDNKVFVDQLVFDGILTEKECNDARGTSSILGTYGGSVLQKDMIWLKKILLPKKLGTQTDIYSTTGGTFTTPINFKYQDNGWLWSPDKENWMSVTTTVIKGGFWDGNQPNEENKALIKSLIGKNFDQGNSILVKAGVVVSEEVSIPSTQYNNYASTFEKYASSNHPTLGTTPMSSDDFKSLLAAIAQQNNWGASTRGGSNWIMGYNSGDVNYEGADKQISTVSGILKSVLEGDISNPKSEYRNCISTTALNDRLHCTLSVLKTGKTDSAGILGIGANTDGDNYADSVLTFWNAWKKYFNSVSSSSAH